MAAAKRILLSEMLGIDVERPRGHSGELATGIIGREVATSSPVIIESQYGPADHEYLRQILTTLRPSKATTIIWVAEEFSEKHWAALDWLNAHTGRTIRFFGIRLAAVTLEGTPAGLIAPHLELVVKTQQGVERARLWFMLMTRPCLQG